MNNITNQTLLVGMTFGLPRQSRQLDEEAQQLEKTSHAQHGTIKASVHYFKRKDENNPKKEIDGLASLKTFQHTYKKSLEHLARYPFAAGARLLPAALAAQFAEANEKFKDQQQAVWQAWADDEYVLWKESAPQRMGSLYDPEDFPSLKDCAKRFACDVDVFPLAEAEQWKRISLLSPDLAATMEATSNEKVNKAVANAQAQIWADVLQPIQHMVTVLSKDKGKIFDSMVGNIIDIVDLVPAYNLEKDSKLAELAEQAKTALATIKPDDLRKSADARALALSQAKGILNAFQPFARKFAA